MKPHLTTSPRPATSSARGSVARVARSQSTPAGSWKEPTRFLPAPVLMPVLPPTAASTMAEQRGRHVHDPHAAQPGRGDEAAEVGRRAAAEGDDRVGAGEAGRAEHLPAGRRRPWPSWPLSPSGIVDADDLVVVRTSASTTASAARLSGCTTATRVTPVAEQRGQPVGDAVTDHDVVRRRAGDPDHGLASCACSQGSDDLVGDLVRARARRSRRRAWRPTRRQGCARRAGP